MECGKIFHWWNRAFQLPFEQIQFAGFVDIPHGVAVGKQHKKYHSDAVYIGGGGDLVIAQAFRCGEDEFVLRHNYIRSSVFPGAEIKQFKSSLVGKYQVIRSDIAMRSIFFFICDSEHFDDLGHSVEGDQRVGTFGRILIEFEFASRQ